MMIRWWVRVAHGEGLPTQSACVIGSSSLWLHGFFPVDCAGVMKLVKGNWLQWRNLRRYRYNFVRRDTCPDRIRS